MSLPAMLFAAGFGTRMGALTEKTPKPLLRVGDQTLVDHALGLVHQAGCAPVVVNTHYHADQMAAHLGDRVHISHETPEILDSGGGLKAAGHWLGQAAVTLNADTVWIGANPIAQLLAAWQPEEMDCLMLLTPVENALAYTRSGDFFLDQDQRPKRRGAAPHAPLIYSGAQIIKLAALDPFEDPIFSLNTVWDSLSEKTRLKAVIYDGVWVDVGTPEGLAVADETLRAEA